MLNIIEDIAQDLLKFYHFRTVNHELTIEYGRWNDIQRRVFNLCNSLDPSSTLLKCSFMSDISKNCINNVSFRNANILKYGKLMNQTKIKKL
jgi:hypothetical protein